MEELGPTYIKVGQMMSVRPDVLPQAALDELAVLQDSVEAFSTKVAVASIEEELGCELGQSPHSIARIEPRADSVSYSVRCAVCSVQCTALSRPRISSPLAFHDNPPPNHAFNSTAQRIPGAVFSEISEEPVAAASLAQVYRAVLKETGEVVAVKVQRPSVLETVSKDLYVLRRAAEVYQGLIERFAPQQRTDYVALLNEWAVGFYTELDFLNEATNQQIVKVRYAPVSQPLSVSHPDQTESEPDKAFNHFERQIYEIQLSPHPLTHPLIRHRDRNRTS